VPLAESAPVAELWVKRARRNGARIVASVDEIGEAERVVLIWSGPGGRGRGRPERARPGGARGVGDRDLDVPWPCRRVGRSRPAGHELPRARGDVREPRGPPPAPAPHGEPTRSRGARVALAARRALRGLRRPVRVDGLRRGVATLLRRALVRRG